MVVGKLHIKTIHEKACKRGYLLHVRIDRSVLGRNSLKQIYFAFTQPVLEYADTVWDNFTEIEVVIRRHSNSRRINNIRIKNKFIHVFSVL